MQQCTNDSLSTTAQIALTAIATTDRCVNHTPKLKKSDARHSLKGRLAADAEHRGHHFPDDERPPPRQTGPRCPTA